jgi:hypothetical protein
MRRKFFAIVFAVGVIAAATAPLASAANHGPNPQPPKCVPANTPGCS